MKRREFLAVTTLFTLSKVDAKDFLYTKDEYSWIILKEVYDVLFVKTSNMPSASEFKAIEYLKKNYKHETFDKSDILYLLQGARDFNRAFPNFLNSTQKNKTKFLKEATNSEYGYSWVSLLLYYGFEAMLGDPIYGGNKDEIAWKALNHQAGIPRPKYKYAKVL